MTHSSSNGYALRTDGLTRDFKTVRAVDGLTIEVPSGIVFGFLGPNGSGKTTTIRLLLGLLEPTAGRAEVLGRDVARDGAAREDRSGALLEHPGLYERLTAEQNLDFYGRVWRLPAAERRARVRELLEPLGLWDRRREIVGTWSRGMKQKLAVARTLLHRPRLVFLDEPTAGLDPVASAALRDDLARLAASEGVTVFLTTHHLAEAERLCALVAVIRQGRLLAVGHPDTLRARSSSRVEVAGRNLDDGVLAALRGHADVRAASMVNGRIAVGSGRGRRRGRARLAHRQPRRPGGRGAARQGQPRGRVPDPDGGRAVIADILTVVRKEWREYVLAGSGLKGGRMGLVIMLAVFGVLLPAQNGLDWVSSPAPLLAWSWVPLMLVSGVVADSFAGERERHTLETLLASRLPDRAILLGKVAAVAAYGWGFALLTAVLSLVSVNAFHWQGHVVTFPVVTMVSIPVFSLLTAMLAATAGVLVSLRAPTARQAGQMLSIAVMLILFVPIFGIKALPAEVRATLFAVLMAGGVQMTLALLAVVLVVVDAALLAAGMMRFQRSRLLLD